MYDIVSHHTRLVRRDFHLMEQEMPPGLKVSDTMKKSKYWSVLSEVTFVSIDGVLERLTETYSSPIVWRIMRHVGRPPLAAS